MNRLWLSTGTNLGDRARNLSEAERMIGDRIGRIMAYSSIFETQPWGFEAEQDFLNRVMRVETILSPEEVLDRIRRIEESSGRIRYGKGFASRVLDIDILFYNDGCFENAELVIPHPRIAERRFVLVPLAEIAPELVHPRLGKRISQLLEECTDPCRVRKIDVIL